MPTSSQVSCCQKGRVLCYKEEDASYKNEQTQTKKRPFLNHILGSLTFTCLLSFNAGSF